jgi:hypothetical protein
MKDFRKPMLLAVFAVGLWSSWAYGEEAVGSADNWQLSVTPYMWFSEVTGHVISGGNRIPVDISFSDIWDALDCAGLVHVEAAKERWGVFVDPLYMKLGASKDVTVIVPDGEDVVLTAQTKVALEMWMVEFGGFYRLAQWSPAGEDNRTTKLDILGGARYWNFDQTIKSGAFRSDISADWTDPFVGMRVSAPVNDWLSLNARADVGGFQVSSDASNVSWNIFVGPAIKLSDNTSLVGGYRWLTLDRDKSSDSKTDVTLRGPLVALQIRF